MGFRDDHIALESRVETLTRDVAPLEGRVAELRQEERRLSGLLRKRRARLFVHRAMRLLWQHPILTFIAALGAWLVIDALEERMEQQRAHQQRVDSVLGRDCDSTLEVVASTKRSRVSVNNVFIGQTPLRVPICAGSYRLQLSHSTVLPWSTIVQVPEGSTKRVFHRQLSWHNVGSLSGRTAIFSTPENATVYAAGLEVGRTPVVLTTEPRERSFLIALSKPGFEPVIRRMSRNTQMWLHLQRTPDGRDDIE